MMLQNVRTTEQNITLRISKLIYHQYLIRVAGAKWWQTYQSLPIVGVQRVVKSMINSIQSFCISSTKHQSSV